MDILDGTDTRGPIRLGFTRDEFDDLCNRLAADEFPLDGTAGKILRFRECFAEADRHEAN